jgi:hypothetical protein
MSYSIKSLVIFLIASTLLCRVSSIGTRDAIAFWGGIQSVIHGGNPYDQNLVLRYQQEIYPDKTEPQYFLNPPWAIPVLLVFFSPPFEIARILLMTVSLLIIAYTILFLRECFGGLSQVGLVVFALSTPFLATIWCGQLSALILLGFILILKEFNRASPRAEWLAIGIILLAVKPQTTYLLIIATCILALRTRRPYFASYMIIGLGALLIAAFWVPDLITGWSSTFSYSTLWRTASVVTYIRSSLMHWGFSDQWLLWGIPLSTTLALMTYCLGLKSVEAPQSLFLLIALISALTAPYIWIYDLIILSPHLYLILRTAQDARVSRAYRGSLMTCALCAACPVYALFSQSFEIFVVYSGVILIGWLFRYSALKCISYQARCARGEKRRKRAIHGPFPHR